MRQVLESLIYRLSCKAIVAVGINFKKRLHADPSRYRATTIATLNGKEYLIKIEISEFSGKGEIVKDASMLHANHLGLNG